MKILYGVQGTGNGHIARARAMCSKLAEQGLEVDYLFSGRDASKYFSMEQFGDYQTRHGLSFVTDRGKVSLQKTLVTNNLVRFHREVADLDLSDYDLILNDFEPVSAWAARQQNKPSISISHQNAFRYSVPLRGITWFDKLVMRYFAPARHHIGLHWYHFGQPILPPIVHSIGGDICDQDFILVYLPFENPQEISELLLRFTTQTFICYHPDVVSAYQQDNVRFLPPNFETFQQHLHSCSGVFANGGFELPSEALSLGKKLLLKPLHGQFEQMSNVATLESLGLATGMDNLDAGVVRQWLDEEASESIHYPDVAHALVTWIQQGEWDCQQALTRSLWDKVDFPSYVTHI